MPILNNLTVNEIVSGQVPNYYLKKAIDGNGKLIVDTSQTTFSTSPATDVGTSALAAVMYKRSGTGNITVDCSSLTKISGENAFANAFYGASDVTSYDFSNITTITGRRAFENAWGYITSGGSASLSFPALERIGAANVFAYCLSDNIRIHYSKR